MTARDKTRSIMERFAYRGINLSFAEVNTLRRAVDQWLNEDRRCHPAFWELAKILKETP